MKLTPNGLYFAVQDAEGYVYGRRFQTPTLTLHSSQESLHSVRLCGDGLSSKCLRQRDWCRCWSRLKSSAPG